MKYQIIAAVGALLPTLAVAFPGMAGTKEEMLKMIREREDATAAHKKVEDRGLITDILGTVSTGVSDLLGTLTSDIEGLLGSVASSVDASDLRPQPGYTFQAPGSDDSRGPCPGLNLLANYGYLPRDGYVTFSEVVNATAVGFNMGADLATVLCVFATLADGDLATESWYLGANNGLGGLNRHSTVEADVSPNREDYYNGCGDNHHLSSSSFNQNVQLAANGSKDFGLATMTEHFALKSAFTKKYNPYVYYFPFPAIVSFAAFAFYPNFFSNGTYGSGGVANYESISSIIGARYDNKTGHFEYVPERWPENWYRRSYEYDAVTAMTQGFEIYLSNPIFPLFGQVGASNLNATTILCDIYQGIESIVPLFLDGTDAEISAAVSWALGKLDPYFTGTDLGCPDTAVSGDTFLYPNSTEEGGPLDPPPSVAANVGNNVYYSVYFTATPTAPLCSHAAAATA